MGSYVLQGGLIEEVRFLDTGALDDYYIQFTCSDRGGARRGWCFSYYVALVIRHDPPSNFPWDKAVYDLKRLGIKARDFISVYLDEGKFYYNNFTLKAQRKNATENVVC